MTQAVARIVLACALLLAGAGGPALATQNSLRLGVLPFVSPEKLMAQFRHLSTYLERELGRKIDIRSAPGYRAFVASTAAQRYDLVFTPPHLAALAVAESGFVPVVKTDPPVHSVLYVRRNGNIASLSDLAGKTVATPHALGLVTIWSANALRREGMTVGRDILIQPTPSHDNALLLAAHGLADAAVAVSTILNRMPLEVRAELIALRDFGETFAMTYLAAPDMPVRERERLTRLLLAFPTTPEGARFFLDGPVFGHAKTTEADLRPFMRQIPALKARLSEMGVK